MKLIQEPAISTPPDIFAAGWEIVKDRDTDYLRFSARHWVEESGLCDTEEEAARECREYLGLPPPPDSSSNGLH